MSNSIERHVLAPQKVSWTKRDALLFACSIGCSINELHFLYELHPQFQLFPTYAMILPFKLADTDIIDFYSRREAIHIPGAPKLDPRRVVDGGRCLKILKPLPTTSNCRNFELRSSILGIYDKGKLGTVVETQDEIYDAATGEVYTVAVGSDFFLDQGNWSGPRGRKPPSFHPPDRLPDACASVKVTSATAHLYRLNGDYNPLHAINPPGIEMGYGGMILHGLYGWNNAALAVLREFGDSKGDNLTEFRARFASPVRPDDELQTDMWRVSNASDKVTEVRFITRIRGGAVCLSHGRAILKTAHEAKI